MKKIKIFIIKAKHEFKFFKTLYLLIKIICNHERHYMQLPLFIQLVDITSN